MVLESTQKRRTVVSDHRSYLCQRERVPGGNTLEDTLEYLKYLDEFRRNMYDVSCSPSTCPCGIRSDSTSCRTDGVLRQSRKENENSKACDRNAVTTVTRRSLKKFSRRRCRYRRNGTRPDRWAELGEKVENGEEDLLRKCISCNVGCTRKPYRRQLPPIRWHRKRLFRADIYKALVNKNCNVVVVGAGTAGMKQPAPQQRSPGCNVFVL